MGFRKGQMEAQLEMADVNDLVHMLPIVTSCITLLPFGMVQNRKKLKKILEKKIKQDAYLKMQFYFFLASFLGCHDVKRLFRKHKIMKLVKQTSEYYNYQWDEAGLNIQNNNFGNRVYSRRGSVMSEATTMTNITMTTAFGGGSIRSPKFDDDGSIIGDLAGLNMQSYNMNHRLPKLHTLNNYNFNTVDIIMSDDDEDNLDRKEDDDFTVYHETVIYTENDPIKLFRLSLDNHAQPGYRIVIPRKQQNRFFDPINGNKNVQQLEVKKIFTSNAKPYLLDCYVHDINSINDVKLSSSFILKQGDDLRKDAAVLKMFEFMNHLWEHANLKYIESNVKSLTYKCIPMGPDIGIIELIPGCIELNKISQLKTKLSGPQNIKFYNNLVATAAGAYIAAYVMGIRDRHDDNILIKMTDDECTLFHIDFGYMFGDRVSLDTAKLAITSDLKKIFDINKFGWNDFIHTCISAWLILRNNANELIDYARVVFAFLYETNQIEMFLRQSLKLDIQNDQIATKYIHDKLKNAPKQLKTKMKNLVHGFAQKIKANNNNNNQQYNVSNMYSINLKGNDYSNPSSFNSKSTF